MKELNTGSPLKNFQSAASKITVKSALNPALWFLGITPICWIFAFFLADYRLCMVIAGLAPIAVVTVGFLYLLLKDPDKLQSEEYQLTKIWMSAGKQTGVVPDSETLPSVPKPPLITDGGGPA